jgi:hypothetical protein
VQGDATQVHQILLNLFVNARDAMPNGGRIQIKVNTVTVDERATRFYREPVSGRFVLIEVSDTGMGIPTEVLPKIFEPFFTTKDPGKGTGLGLSTVLGIVKGHGGFVEVFSQPGNGTSFLVYLPTDELEPEIEEKALDPGSGRNEGILVVDDEAAILEITRETLAAFGYRVLTTGTCEEAIALFKRHAGEVNLVIADLIMPGMSGQTLIAGLRKIKPDVRVIAVSGVPVEARQVAANYFLKKPYGTPVLLKTVRSVLDSPQTVAG